MEKVFSDHMFGKESAEQYEAFEVLTLVVTKSSIFWGIMYCSLLKVNRSFGVISRLHLQSQRICGARK
jgi:hypothetical protein